MVLKNEKGQTAVEYILLMVVATSLALTFYNSRRFKEIFGNDGKLGARIKTQTESAFRHGYSSNQADIAPGNRDVSVHPTYSDQAAGTTRFFGPRRNYP